MISQQYERNLIIKRDNENKLKILKENKATFTIAFNTNNKRFNGNSKEGLSSSIQRMEEQISLRLIRTLGLKTKNIRLISVNTDTRLENDRDVTYLPSDLMYNINAGDSHRLKNSITVYLYEIMTDDKCKEQF